MDEENGRRVIDSVPVQHTICCPLGRKLIDWSSSIYVKLGLLVVGLVLISSAVLVVVMWTRSSTAIEILIERRLITVASLRSQQFLDFVEGELEKANVVRTRIILGQLLKNETKKGLSQKEVEVGNMELQSVASSISRYEACWALDYSGNIVFSSNLSVVETGSWLKDQISLHSLNESILDPPKKDPISGLEMRVTSPILVEGTKVGFLQCVINASKLLEIGRSDMGVAPHGQVIVGYKNHESFDDPGNITLLVPPLLTPNVTTLHHYGPLAMAVSGVSGFKVTKDYTGVKVAAAFQPIGYQNWGISAEAPVSYAYEQLFHLRNFIIIAISVILTVCLFLAWLASRAIAVPIVDLWETASRLASGELTARAQGGNKWWKDESDKLRKTFNAMADQLTVANANLEAKVAERTQELGRTNSNLANEIEERKRVEKDLQLARASAEAANRAKSQWLANMSHEIRTPLNGVLNCTELCLGTVLDTEQREYLSLSLFSAKHLLRIITDILDFSKIEAGKLDMENIEFSLFDQMENAVSVLAARAHNKGIEILCWWDPQVPDFLLGDPSRVFQIFINLLGNAIKFTNNGTVEIFAKVKSFLNPSKVEIIFTVKDTGIGIPKDKHSLLFQAFSQVDPSTTRVYGGTGLGLVISSKLSRAMGGKMWVDSDEGKGSSFFFTANFSLPTRSEAKSPGIVFQEEVTKSLKNVRAIIVEKQKATRFAIQNILKEWGFVVEEAESGKEALEKIQKAASQKLPFDLMLLDKNLPTVDINDLGASELVKVLQMKKGLLKKIPLLGDQIKKSQHEDESSLQKETESMLEEELPSAFKDMTNIGKLFEGKDSSESSIPQGKIPDSTCSDDGSDGKSTRNLQRANDNLPIVMMTLSTNEVISRENKVHYWIKKPIKRAQLLKTIKKILKIDTGSSEDSPSPILSPITVVNDVFLSRKLVILVAEDHPINQRVVLTLLHKWGHETQLAENGAQTVEIIRKEQKKFDIILMDVQMPVMDGLEATSKIRAIEKDRMTYTPIVAMTAHAMIGDGQKCLEAGMDSYLSKPLNSKKMQALLNLVSEKKSLPTFVHVPQS